MFLEIVFVEMFFEDKRSNQKTLNEEEINNLEKRYRILLTDFFEDKEKILEFNREIAFNDFIENDKNVG